MLLIFISHKINLIYEQRSVLSKKWFANEEVIIRFKTKCQNPVISTSRFDNKGNPVLFPEVAPDGTHIQMPTNTIKAFFELNFKYKMIEAMINALNLE